MKKIRKYLSLACILLLLTSCSLPGLGGNTEKEVVIATGSTSERQILGYMVEEMIKHYTDLKVDTVTNLNSTTLINVAMTKGDVNVSGGMYTGTSLTGELGMEPIKDPDKALKVVQEEYLKRYNRIWYPSFGFANTYAFMVREDYAKEHKLEKVSDLAKLKGDIKVGVDTSWIDRPGDGYQGFQETYGFAFDHIYPMQIGLVYSALSSNNMDVVLGYSTDGRVASYNLKLLEDDLRLFPPYDCSPVAQKEIIDKYPELNTIFLKLAGTIDSKTMQELNRKSDEDLIEPQVIAQEFLKDHNYFEDKEVEGK